MHSQLNTTFKLLLHFGCLLASSSQVRIFSLLVSVRYGMPCVVELLGPLIVWERRDKKWTTLKISNHFSNERVNEGLHSCYF
ncbi:hypothetical protein Hanom_Chr06g00486651 [Helianthus anomalus]